MCNAIDEEVWKRLTSDTGREFRFSSWGRYQEEVNGEWVDREPHYDKCNGYMVITQCGFLEKKVPTLHTVIATLFVSRPPYKVVVDHKDTNKLNNRADNLEWVTIAENNQRKKKKPQRCKWRCIETSEIFESKADIARKLNRRSDSVITILNSDDRCINGLHFEPVIENKEETNED